MADAYLLLSASARALPGGWLYAPSMSGLDAGMRRRRVAHECTKFERREIGYLRSEIVRWYLAKDCEMFLLDHWREPIYKRKCFASITVELPANISNIFLIKAQVHPGHKPTELNYNEWALKANHRHYCWKREINHWQTLYVYFMSWIK